MIQKVMSKSIIPKQSFRIALQESSRKLKNLAGSSLGEYTPNWVKTDMIIPGGLSYPEKFYYLLKGKLPPSVYERWQCLTDDFIPQPGDQVVTVNISGPYVGNLLNEPHDYIPGEQVNFKSNTQLDINDGDYTDLLNNDSDTNILDGNDDDNGGILGILKHLGDNM